MRILITGKDKFTYNRTLVLLNGLALTPGVELIYFPIEKRRNFDSAKFRALSETVDLVYIPPFRHSDVKFIKQRSAAPVFFDALISKYLTRTIDHSKWWTGIEKTWRDRVAFKYSDFILMDTEHHREYLIDRYKLAPTKVYSLPVGVDTSLFAPFPPQDNEKFTVGFYGGFIPLQGVDKLIKAAQLLNHEKDIQFDIIGKGPRFDQVVKLSKKLQNKHVNFAGWVPYAELNARINSYDLCLGIFGDSLKTDLVIPNKIYHYSALRKCTLTKATPAIDEVFLPRENIITTENTPEAIAEGILHLKNHPELRNKIANHSFDLITQKYNHMEIARLFLKIVEQAIGKK